MVRGLGESPELGAIVEGDSGTVVASVPIPLSGASSMPLTIGWATFDTGGAGVATAGGEVCTAQLRVGEGSVMIGPGLKDFGTRAAEPDSLATCRIHVSVDDVDAHHERSVAAGFTVEDAPTDHGPVRIYIATDIGSHQWIFAEPIDD